MLDVTGKSIQMKQGESQVYKKSQGFYKCMKLHHIYLPIISYYFAIHSLYIIYYRSVYVTQPLFSEGCRPII